jgi:hypothetical protein
MDKDHYVLKKAGREVALYIYINKCICIYMNIYSLHPYDNLKILQFTWIYVYIYTYVYMYIYVFIYIYTYPYLYKTHIILIHLL